MGKRVKTEIQEAAASSNITLTTTRVRTNASITAVISINIKTDITATGSITTERNAAHILIILIDYYFQCGQDTDCFLKSDPSFSRLL